MRVLIAGGVGGREHALAWKIAQSSLLPQIFHWPAHPCGNLMGSPLDLPADATDEQVATLARALGIDLVVIGPEGPLSRGMADVLRENGLKVFGPGRDGAQLEASKAYAKDLMAAAGIPTATFRICQGREATRHAAIEQLARDGGVVLKASGLAAGKGVFVCGDRDGIEDALQHLFSPGMAAASETVVLEELMSGRESSYFVFINTESDVRASCAIGMAVDYKRLKTGNQGPNTGGMGGYAPVPWISEEETLKLEGLVVRPVVAALRERGVVYQGCLYIGLMWTPTGPKVVEFNCRFGDPEAEILARGDKRDWLPMLAAAAGVKGFTLGDVPEAAVDPTVGIVVASQDYPFGEPLLTDSDRAKLQPLPPAMLRGGGGGECVVFGAGITRAPSGSFTYGKGRMLVVTATGRTFKEAAHHARSHAERVSALWPVAQWRADIASEVL